MSALTPWPDDAQALLIEAATSPEPDNALRAWKSFLSLDPSLDDPGHWSLIPATYVNLARRLRVEDFPRIEELRLSWMRTLLGNRQRFEAMEGILPGLVALGVPVMVIKGRAVLELHYGDLGARPSLDADIMVPADRIPEAGRYLERLGWSPKGGQLADVGSAWRHALGYVNPDGRTVDLHAYLLFANRWQGIDDMCWARSRPFLVGQTMARSLADADHLIHACAHGIRGPTRSKAYWVADALMIIGCGSVNWTDVVDMVRVRRLPVELGAVLRMLRGRFGAAVPAEVVTEISAMPTTWTDRFVASNRPCWREMQRFILYARAHPNENVFSQMFNFCRPYSNPVLNLARTVRRILLRCHRRVLGLERSGELP